MIDSKSTPPYFSTLMFILPIPGIWAQPQVRGSQEASQLAVNSFQFILAAPRNCLETLADLPRGLNKNMAALWIRAAFHDAGTWDPLAELPGGADASLLSFLNEAENMGLEESIAPKFMQNPRVNMSRADMIALAGQVSVTHCGGPSLPFRPGRADAVIPVSPVGRLPDGAMRLDRARAAFDRMGWTNEDIVALVTGSHTMGGVHAMNSPNVTNRTFTPFDDTAGIFDNHIFKFVLENKCAAPIDCDIANDPVLRPIVQRYANDQNAFFEQYKISYQKLIGQTTSTLGQPQNLIIDLHVGLFETKQPPTIWDPPAGTSTTAPQATKSNSAYRTSASFLLLLSLLL